jgi:hypothetical protein
MFCNGGNPMQAIAAAATAGSVGAAAPQPRLVRAAHEFEAQMMKELMKPMTSGGSLTGADQDTDGDSGSDSGSGGALGEFGIASRIVKDLSQSGNRATIGPVTGNLHGDTVMRAFK